LFVGEYVNPASFGTGYQYGYSGGAMKSASYSVKAAGPYGGMKSAFSVNYFTVIDVTSWFFLFLCLI